MKEEDQEDKVNGEGRKDSLPFQVDPSQYGSARSSDGRKEEDQEGKADGEGRWIPFSLCSTPSLPVVLLSRCLQCPL